MEAITGQASKLRKQVAKQALLKQLGQLVAEAIIVDGQELKHQLRHQQLQNLYSSTSECKKDFICRCQGFAAISTKQMDILRKLAKDCCKYGTKEECSTSLLAEIAFEMDHLRSLVRDPQLEDARLLVRHYEK